MKMDPGAQSSWRWMAAAAAVVLIVLMAVLMDDGVANALGVRGMKPHFMDWVALLAAGDAHRAGANVYADPNPFDPWGRPHSYGPWWMLLGDLGFTVRDRWWMGGLLAGTFVVGAILVLAPGTPRKVVVAVGMMISPPVMLGMERANNDLVVFLILAASSWMISRNQRIGVWGSAALTGLAAALKLYPLAALAGLPAVRCRRRTVYWTAGLVLIACALVAFWYWDDYTRAIAVVPKGITVFTYGMRALLFVAKDAFEQPWSVGLGLAAGIGLGALVLGRRLGELYHAVPIFGGTAFAYAAGSACWIFCYLINTNLPYRAVLLLLPARLWLSHWDDGPSKMLSRRCCVLILVQLWAAYGSVQIHRWFEQEPAAAASWLMTVVSFEQALTLIVTIALLVSLMGWGARRWRTPDPGG